MTGKHTIFDTRRVTTHDSHNISPAPCRPDHAADPTRPDESSLNSSFLAERGATGFQSGFPAIPTCARK